MLWEYLVPKSLDGWLILGLALIFLFRITRRDKFIHNYEYKIQCSDEHIK